MGFYGNITNTNKSQFTFDTIYHNRKEMDDAINNKTDGIFIGRFVLVEYDPEVLVHYYDAYLSNGEYYKVKTSASDPDEKIEPNDGTVIRVNNGMNDSYEFLIAYNKQWKPKKQMYQINYEIDANAYGSGRGFDSTVWQKTMVEDKEKYVMIAELNSVVPQFKITADAPTETPLAPHFDKKSTNTTYWLHVQPSWGFRVKENNDLSDEEVLVSTSKYVEANGNVTETNTIKNGEIFYNKKGFNPDIRNFYSGDAKDAIQITSTGKSGNLYNDNEHDGNLVEKEDIKEFSLILPSLGNAVSTMWDMAYGAVANEQKRNKDIKWGSYDGVRLVEENVDGSGFDFNTTGVESIAGCINSVHDLMGMIIDNISDGNYEPENLDDNRIYYLNGKYYRRFINYNYENVIEGDGSQKPQKLYDLIGKLENYNRENYYSKDSWENYNLSKDLYPQENRNYYTVSATKKELRGDYSSGEYYYEKGNNIIKKDVSNTASLDRIYYKPTINTVSLLFYVPNKYFYKSGSDVILDNSSVMTSNREYYTMSGNFIKEEFVVQEIDENGNPVTDANGNPVYKTEIKYVGGKLTPITLFNFALKNYYSINEKDDGTEYTRIEIAPSEKTTCYTIDLGSSISNFYIPNIYYNEENKNYIKDKEGKFSEDKDYYKIIATLSGKFYIQNKYYYQDGTEYILDTNSTAIEGRNYYELKKYYVISDLNGLFNIGEEWNMNVSVPEKTTIGTRAGEVVLQELEGFARDFNTIHGLILRMRKLLESHDAETRDLSTVQGSINKLNDIISKFENLQPGKMILIDDYGRINSANYSTDKWLEWEVDTNPTNLNIGIKHLGAQEIVTNISQGNKNPKFGETITTPKIAIDANGHINSIINEEVTLPKSSLTVNGSGVLTSTSLIAETGELTANYTALSDIILDGYEKTASTGAIAATDSLEIGLSKIENAISFTNEAIEEIDIQLREDFTAESTVIRSEFTAVDTAIRAEFAAADTTLQNNINNINTSLGNRITAIENKNDFGVGALTTRVEANENKLTGISTTVVDSITNAVNELSAGQVETNKQSIEELNTRVSTVETTLKDVPSVGAALESTHQRIGGIENRVATIEDQFKGSDIAEDGTETLRTYGILKWYNQESMPDTQNGEITLWFDTTTGEIKLYNGLMWVVLTITTVA